MNLAENGCLLAYLQKTRASQNYQNISNPESDLTLAKKVKLAFGIAKGMEHLGKKKVSGKMRKFYLNLSVVLSIDQLIDSSMDSFFSLFVVILSWWHSPSKIEFKLTNKCKHKIIAKNSKREDEIKG